MPSIQPIIDALSGFPDATRMTVKRGEVLIHANHIARGLYVLLSGVLDLVGDNGISLTSVSASNGPILIPARHEWNQPANWTVRTAQAAELLFIPRSTLMLDDRVHMQLQLLNLPAHCLCAQPACEELPAIVGATLTAAAPPVPATKGKKQ